MSDTIKIPTEIIDLPSKGLVYPLESPLSKGSVELKYPTAKQEDILTNINYLSKGTAIDKFLESILVQKFDLEELIAGDRDALMVAARIMAYGSTYSILGNNQEIVDLDLSTMEEKVLDEDKILVKNRNLFEFTLPKSGAVVQYKLLTGKDTKNMDTEEAGLKKLFPDFSANVSLSLIYAVQSINGNSDEGFKRKFIESMLSLDSKALRNEIKNIAPGYNWIANGVVRDTKEVVEGLRVPFGVGFFWPEL